MALDLVAIRLMGFDVEQIPKVREAMRDEGMRVTAVRSPDDVEVAEARPGRGAPRITALRELPRGASFAPHSGWRGHLGERAA